VDSLSRNPFVGFAPWIAFAGRGPGRRLGSGRDGWTGVVGLFLDRAELDWIEQYSTVISMGAIAGAVLGSLAFVPFTSTAALLNWIIPVALIVGGFKYNAHYVSKARARAGHTEPAKVPA
jgi:hypothetical protein